MILYAWTATHAHSRLAGFVSRQSQSSTDPQGAQYFADSLLAADDNAEEFVPPRPRRLRKEHRPTHEVSKLLGQANLANINEGSQAAVNLYLEVIRLDPYVFAAWNSLASCYDELGNPEAARQMRFCGAHVGNDADAWRELAAEFRWVIDDMIHPVLTNQGAGTGHGVHILLAQGAQARAQGCGRTVRARCHVSDHRQAQQRDFLALLAIDADVRRLRRR